MADYDTRKVDAFFGKDSLLLEASASMGMSVSRDGDARAAMCLGDGSQDALDSTGHTGLVGRAFQDGGFDSGAGDAFLNVANEHVDHHLGPLEHSARSPKVKVHRHVVVGVDSCSDYDVQVDLPGDPLNAGNVAAQPDYSQVDDRIDSCG